MKSKDKKTKRFSVEDLLRRDAAGEHIGYRPSYLPPLKKRDGYYSPTGLPPRTEVPERETAEKKPKAKRRQSPSREMTYSMFPQSTIDTFWNNVDVRGEDECWWWLGDKDSNGYGSMRSAGLVDGMRSKWLGAHRAAYVIGTKKNIPAGMLIMHKCDSPPCCNPNHLKPGTPRDNYEDMVSKGRGGRLG